MSQYAQQALAGSQLAGARLIRLLEDESPEGIDGLKEIYPHTGRAYILGITGPPGAGKSTLVDRIVSEFRRRERTVGVVAVDPSSPFSGGAILGDRVRMQRHSDDDGVFVRSMATRGHLGGLSKGAGQAVLVLDAMGYDVVLIETVGVGQDEVEIVDLAHTTAVVSLPGMGDDIQAMKAGILEIGDVFIVNKADKGGADQVVRQLRAMLEMRHPSPDGWMPPVMKAVAVKNQGIAEIVDTFLEHRRHLEEGGHLAGRMQERELRFFRDLVKEMAARRVFDAFGESAAYAELVESLKVRKTDPYSAAEQLLEGMCLSPEVIDE